MPILLTIVCKKVQGDGGFISTNYIYDDLERLAYVVPPIPTGTTYPTSFTEADAIFNNFIYGYHYDERSRIVEKKIPGKGWEYMIYNLLDQLVMTQDAVQRSKSPQQWTFTKYDAQARIVMTGIYTDDEHSDPGTNYRQNFQGIVNYFPAYETRDYTSTTTGYTDNAVPLGSITGYLTINYYDNYTSIPGLPAGYSAPTGASSMTTGLPTASLTNVLGTTNMLWNVNYYDDLGRVTTTYKQHYLGGTANTSNYDVVTNTYNFTNQVTATTRQHYTAASGLALTIANTYTYDHVGRKTQTYEQINGSANTLISQTDYNEIGQPLKKHLGNNAQQVAYAYNERGWLKSSTAPLFTMSLNYNDGTLPQYNGNIANQTWSSAASNGNYTYRYDAMNRLLSGIANTGNTEKSIVYDEMGNIKSLQRYLAGAEVDALKYDYTSGGNQTNQLQIITDSTTNDAGLKHGTSTYAYDGNGNMVTDNSKGLSITYNMLNLPNVNTLSGGTVSYIYDANGNKLRKVNTVGTASTTDYIDGIQYTNGAIDFVQTEEGRALNNGGTYSYQYNLSDHLGDTRLSFNNTGSVIQQDDYLPFGYDISVSSIGNPKNNYLYNNKELQTGLGQYDYNARFYDPILGRFVSVDKLADKYPWYTQYQFAGNEVPNAVDRDGLEAAYVEKGAHEGRNIIGRDNQLAKPITNSEEAAYFNSKTQIGGTYKLLDIVSDGSASIGTALQGAGYLAAPFTEGASLSLVGIGEGFDLIGSGAGAINDYAKGDIEHAAITATTTVAFGALGKGLEKLETVGKLASHEKTILAAGLTTASKILDKGLESKKSEESKVESKADATSAVKPKIQNLKVNDVNPQAAQNFFKQANQ